MALAQAWQGQTAQLASLGKSWTQGPLLPIRVVLRRFAEHLPTGDQPARAGDLWRFISEDLDASGYGLSGKAMDYVQRIARTKGALIVLDGLDECGDAVRRGRVLAAVKELMRSAGPQCRFLLTARPYAWPGGPDPERGVYALAELNDDQIEQFIRAWYAALVRRKWRQPGEIGSKIDDLLQARQRRDLLPLARNPLLLTLMATLHTNRGRLPDDRVDLYNDSVDLLLVRWNQQVGADQALLDALNVPGLKLSSLREVLEGLAFKVHGENVGQEGTADIGEGKLLRTFRPLLKNSWDKAAMVVDYIDTRAGLLVGQGSKDGERQFTFPHRTFQEFLAACHLAGQVDVNARGVELARQHAGHWKEVLVLAARQAKSDRGAALADALIGGEPFDPASQFVVRVCQLTHGAAQLLDAEGQAHRGLGQSHVDGAGQVAARRVPARAAVEFLVRVVLAQAAENTSELLGRRNREAQVVRRERPRHVEARPTSDGPPAHRWHRRWRCGSGRTGSHVPGGRSGADPSSCPAPSCNPCRTGFRAAASPSCPVSASLMACANSAGPSPTMTWPVTRSSWIPATCSIPPLIGNRPPPRACGASNSLGSTASRSTARAVNNSRSSVNVRTSSTSASRSGDAASRFLAMHGPMKTMRNAGACCSRRSLAIAIIGDTIGARLDVSPG